MLSFPLVMGIKMFLEEISSYTKPLSPSVQLLGCSIEKQRKSVVAKRDERKKLFRGTEKITDQENCEKLKEQISWLNKEIAKLVQEYPDKNSTCDFCSFLFRK